MKRRAVSFHFSVLQAFTKFYTGNRMTKIEVSGGRVQTSRPLGLLGFRV